MNLSSPQLLSKKYMPWRILRAPGKWAPAYIERARELRGYKSAVVFPEQMIPLNGATLFYVNYASDNSNHNPQRQTSEVNVSITKWPNARLTLVGGLDRPTPVDVYAFEDDHENDLNQILISCGTWDKPFLQSMVFSAKRDALEFAKSRLKLISD